MEMSKGLVHKKHNRPSLHHRLHGSNYTFTQINQDNVVVTGGDDGTLKFWDWESGYNFQEVLNPPQPGSIAAENGIFSITFDRSGCRMISGECDKTIKMWKED